MPALRAASHTAASAASSSSPRAFANRRAVFRSSIPDISGVNSMAAPPAAAAATWSASAAALAAESVPDVIWAMAMRVVMGVDMGSSGGLRQ